MAIVVLTMGGGVVRLRLDHGCQGLYPGSDGQLGFRKTALCQPVHRPEAPNLCPEPKQQSRPGMPRPNVKQWKCGWREIPDGVVESTSLNN